MIVLVCHTKDNIYLNAIFVKKKARITDFAFLEQLPFCYTHLSPDGSVLRGTGVASKILDQNPAIIIFFLFNQVNY
jgi:hypothetical protein